MIKSPVFTLFNKFSTHAIKGIFNSREIIAVCDNKEPFSDIMPFAVAIKNTHPGSVVFVTNILLLQFLISFGFSITTTSPSAIPLEQGIPKR